MTSLPESQGFIKALETERAARRDAIASLKTEVALDLNVATQKMRVHCEGYVTKEDFEKSLIIVDKLTKRLEDETLARKAEFESLSKNVQEMLSLGWVKFKEELALLNPSSTNIRIEESASSGRTANNIEYNKLRQTQDKLIEEVASLKSRMDKGISARGRDQNTRNKSNAIDAQTTNMTAMDDAFANLQRKVESTQSDLSVLEAEVKKIQSAGLTSLDDNAASFQKRSAKSPFSPRATSPICFGSQTNKNAREVSSAKAYAESFFQNHGSAEIPKASPTAFPRTPRVVPHRSPSLETRHQLKPEVPPSIQRMVSAEIHPEVSHQIRRIVSSDFPRTPSLQVRETPRFVRSESQDGRHPLQPGSARLHAPAGSESSPYSLNGRASFAASLDSKLRSGSLSTPRIDSQATMISSNGSSKLLSGAVSMNYLSQRFISLSAVPEAASAAPMQLSAVLGLQGSMSLSAVPPSS